jgi:hypothetical protein
MHTIIPCLIPSAGEENDLDMVTKKFVKAHEGVEAWSALQVKNLDELGTEVCVHR